MEFNYNKIKSITLNKIGCNLESILPIHFDTHTQFDIIQLSELLTAYLICCIRDNKFDDEVTKHIISYHRTLNDDIITLYYDDELRRAISNNINNIVISTLLKVEEYCVHVEYYEGASVCVKLYNYIDKYLIYK